MTDMTTMPEPFIALREDEKLKLGKMPWHPKRGFRMTPDHRGVMWFPYGGSMEGPTLFSQVHPIRQKMCMEGPYCQVCGRILIAAKTPWLLNGKGDPTFDELSNQQPFDTITAPTCQECQVVARQMCPHLKEIETPRLLVKKFRVWGVMGDLHRSTTDPSKNEHGIVVRFGTETAKTVLPWFVGKQLVVEVTRYKVLNAP